LFAWDQTKEKYHINQKGKFDSSLDLFGDFFSGTGNFSGEMTKDELTEALHKYHLVTSFEGTKIIPKAINLLAISKGDFDSEANMLVVDVEIGPSQQSFTNNGISFSSGPTALEDDWIPKYDISGEYELTEAQGGGKLKVTVDGRYISGKHENGKDDHTGFIHEMSGKYISPTEFQLYMWRLDKAKKCEVRLTVTGVADADHSYCSVSHISQAPDTCGLAKNFSEKDCVWGSKVTVVYHVPP
jgi:hypothetical protein